MQTKPKFDSFDRRFLIACHLAGFDFVVWDTEVKCIHGVFPTLNMAQRLTDSFSDKSNLIIYVITGAD